MSLREFKRVHMAATCDKYTIKALDSVVGANSAELRDKILKQLPLDPRKTKQLALNLQLAEGERTKISVNLRTFMVTNGAANVMRMIQLHDRDRPSGTIWVEFDHEKKLDMIISTCLYKVLNAHGPLSSLLLHSLQLEETEHLRL